MLREPRKGGAVIPKPLHNGAPVANLSARLGQYAEAPYADATRGGLASRGTENERCIMEQFFWLIAGACGALGLTLLFRRPARAEISALKQALAEQDTALREAQKGAARDGALAGERKAEIDRLNGDLSKLRARLDEEARKQQQMTGTIARLETAMADTHKAHEEKLAMLTGMRQDMESKFRELAQEALKTQGEAFAKSNIEKLDATLKPLTKDVGSFREKLENIHREATKDRQDLETEIKNLSEQSAKISQEATDLTRALKGDRQKQGAWGEVILETILERSGLREGEEYEAQARRTNAEGNRMQPDVVVNMPGQKTLVIDSKVSLLAYTDAVNAETDAAFEAARKRHVASLRAHIDGLAGKGYQRAEGFTVDYVILFVPIEGAFAEAWHEDSGLTEYAVGKNIMIATPTTLMMALLTIKSVWDGERRSKNAEEIARRAGLLYDKVAGFVKNMKDVGEHLGKAQEAHQKAFGQLSRGRGNVLGQVETLKTLGAKTTQTTLGADFDDEGPEEAARLTPEV